MCEETIFKSFVQTPLKKHISVVMEATEYVDDELPLPPFAEMFGEGSLSNKKKNKKLLGDRSEGNNGDETTGRWTVEEHRLFLEGIMLYGKDWKKMQPLIKTRTLVQIRTHAQKVFKKIGLKKINLGSKSKNGNGSQMLDAAQLAMMQQHMDSMHEEEQTSANMALGSSSLAAPSSGMHSQQHHNTYNGNHNPLYGASSSSSDQHNKLTASMMMPLPISSAQQQQQLGGGSSYHMGSVLGMGSSGMQLNGYGHEGSRGDDQLQSLFAGRPGAGESGETGGYRVSNASAADMPLQYGNGGLLMLGADGIGGGLHDPYQSLVPSGNRGFPPISQLLKDPQYLSSVGAATALDSHEAGSGNNSGDHDLSSGSQYDNNLYAPPAHPMYHQNNHHQQQSSRTYSIEPASSDIVDAAALLGRQQLVLPAHLSEDDLGGDDGDDLGVDEEDLEDDEADRDQFMSLVNGHALEGGGDGLMGDSFQMLHQTASSVYQQQQQQQQQYGQQLKGSDLSGFHQQHLQQQTSQHPSSYLTHAQLHQLQQQQQL